MAFDMLPGVLAIGVTAFIVLGLFWLSGKTKVKKQVLFFRCRDKRGEAMDITKETDRSVLCEQADPPHRFIKVGSSYTFRHDNKTSTYFLGIEGSAYSAHFEGGRNQDPVKVSANEYIRSLWGDKIYDALPNKMKDSLEKDQIGITIEPIKINEKDMGLPALSSDDVNDEGDATILNRLARFGTTENMKQKLLGNLVWMGLGFGMAAVLANFGWF